MNHRKQNTFFYYGWRPACAWAYIIICLFDFIIFPIASALYSHHVGVPFTHWQPLTLADGGLFHLSLGSVLGITSWGRSKEKLADQNDVKNLIAAAPTAVAAAPPAPQQ